MHDLRGLNGLRCAKEAVGGIARQGNLFRHHIRSDYLNRMREQRVRCADACCEELMERAGTDLAHVHQHPAAPRSSVEVPAPT